jgi:2-methylfumaryl-CoA hydratase
MTINLKLSPQLERAQSATARLSHVKKPRYGRSLEELIPGQVFHHPRGLTITEDLILLFSSDFFETNPLYRNREFARAAGYDRLPASPQLVFNVVLSLGVQNDSEQAIANLGYYDVQFLRPVMAGDTLRSATRVLDRRERGAGKPGIAHVRTLGINQHEEVVLQYDRKILVGPSGEPPTGTSDLEGAEFPEVREPVTHIPRIRGKLPLDLTGRHTYYDDFVVGDVIVHFNGRTITDEHFAWTYRVGNTHPLHFDRLYSTGRKGPMSGEPIVYGGLVFAWLNGLASRDTTENAIWELGFTEGYHTQPAFAGDTVYALSRVLHKEEVAECEGAGVVTFQLIGIKNVLPLEALEKFGVDLFLKENDKKDAGKEKIDQKIFEIERRVLIRKRP